MTYLELMFDSDDPTLRPLLAEIGRMPRAAERLRLEAGLCQWWANRCLEQAGAMDGRNRADRDRAARARATREAKKSHA